MNLFDLYFLVTSLLFGIWGFREGIIREAIKLAGFVITIIGLAWFSESIVTLAGSFHPVPLLAAAPILFIGLFALASVAFHLLAEAIHAVIKITPISLLDTGFGALFGMLKATLFAGFLAVLLSFAPQGGLLNRQYETSVSAPILRTMIYTIVPLVRSAVMPFYHEFRPSPEQERRNDENTTGTYI